MKCATEWERIVVVVRDGVKMPWEALGVKGNDTSAEMRRWCPEEMQAMTKSCLKSLQQDREW